MKEKFNKDELIVKIKESQATVPVIMIMGLLLFLSLIFGISSMVGKKDIVETVETASDVQKRDMLTEMGQVMDYLATLDETVLSNQTALDTVADYTTLYKNKSDQLKNVNNEIQKLINNYLNNPDGVDEEAAKALIEILEILEAINSDIEVSDETFTALLEEYKTADEARRLEIEKELQGLLEALTSKSNQLADKFQNLQEFMESIAGAEGQEELYKVLETISNSLERYLAEDMTSFMELLESTSLNMALKLEQGISNLKEEMSFLQESINHTQNDILNLYTTVESNDSESGELLTQEFGAVKNSVSQLNEEFQAAHEEVKKTLKDLNKDMEEFFKDQEKYLEDTFLEQTTHFDEVYEELQGILEEMSTEMETLLTEQFTEMLNTLTEMETTYLSTMEEYHNQTTANFQNMNTHISNQFDTMDTNLLNQYESLSNIVTLGDSDIKTYLESMYGDLKEELSQVFTFVSNGKKLLASALLTKGVECEEDAAFAEIYQSILNIKQTLVIGVEKIPGTIEYDYHYHADGAGNLPHTLTIEVAMMGGCYTTPVYHAHTGSSGGGGGCYSVAHTGYKTVGCGGGNAVNGPHGPDSSGQTYWVGNCSNCGGRVASYGGPGWAACGNTSTVAYTYYTLGCGMNTSTIVAYSPSCGLADGQMVGAHIVYEPAYSSGYNGAQISTMSLRPLPVAIEEEPAEHIPEYTTPPVEEQPETIPDNSAVENGTEENVTPPAEGIPETDGGNENMEPGEEIIEPSEEITGAEDIPANEPQEEIVVEESAPTENSSQEESAAPQEIPIEDVGDTVTENMETE